MPRYNIPDDQHCVDCVSWGIGKDQCKTRIIFEGIYDEVDKILNSFIEETVYYHLYSVVGKCSKFKKKRAETTEDILIKASKGIPLTQDEQDKLDRYMEKIREEEG